MYIKPALLIRLSGVVGAIGAFLFFCIFFILGFIQPEYDHIRNTVSLLVYGKYGWIQSANFVILAFSLLSLSYGLARTVISTHKKSLMTTTFVSVVGVIVILLFPADDPQVNHLATFETMSLIARVHYVVTFGLILSFVATMHFVIEDMKLSKNWRNFATYSTVALWFTLLSGISWYILNELGFIFAIKGLLQKIIVVNVLVWMMLVGRQLYREHA